MKEKLWKWIKRYGVTVWLVTAAIALLVSVSYAAYINLDIAKWVVSTGSGGNSVRFSSNYLYAVDANEENYSTRRITPKTETAEDGSTVSKFTVEVCNYIYGNLAAVNSKDIAYTLKATLLPIDGTLPEGIQNIAVNGTPFNANGELSIPAQLPAKNATSHNYSFSIPSDLAEKISIEIVAEPQSDTDYLATNQKKLAAEITFRDASVADNWRGKFIDQRDGRLPTQYDGFNYEISGSGQGIVTVTWNESILEISHWLNAEEVNGKSWVIEVGGEGKPTAYMTQFYIKDREKFEAEFKSGEDPWKKLDSLVQVTFTPSTSGAGENTGTAG